MHSLTKRLSCNCCCKRRVFTAVASTCTWKFGYFAQDLEVFDNWKITKQRCLLYGVRRYMTNPTKSIQVSKTNCVVLCLVEFIHVSVLILCLNVQTLVDQFGCSVKARVGKVKKGVNVCFFCMFIESGYWQCSVTYWEFMIQDHSDQDASK